MAHSQTALLLLALSAAGAGCASGPPPEPDRELEAAELDRKKKMDETLAEQDKIETVMLTLDKALDKWTEATVVSDIGRAESLQTALEKVLRDTVAKDFDRILRLSQSSDPRERRFRAIAMGSLGFAPDGGEDRALEALISGARSGDPDTIANAAFSLGVLSHPRTPPGVLAQVINDRTVTDSVRRGAAWSLLQVQSATIDHKAIIPVWLEQLRNYETVDPGVLIQALRGTGRTRDKSLADNVVPSLRHPAPLVRSAAAIALGYLRKRDTYRALLPLIEPGEVNPNVRLAAAKALQELAGGETRGYNVDQWRKLFEVEQPVDKR